MMGIVSDSEFNSELDKLTPNNGDNKIVGEIKDIERGRGKDNLEVPQALRKIIGEESAINGRQNGLELANRFGISPSSVSAYNQGAHSTATYDNRPDIDNINGAKFRVAKRARNKLVLALNLLTREKIENAKARDISGVAKDMSAVIRNMEPETQRNPLGNGPTFIFYSPHFRSENNFDVIHLKE